jgi:hypothetical protein
MEDKNAGVILYNTGNNNAMQNAGNNSTQSQSVSSLPSEQQSSPQEILELLAEIEQEISDSEIPVKAKMRSTAFLNSAKASIDEKEPDKKGAKTDLGRLVKNLQDVSKTVVAGKSLFEAVQPTITKIGDWLG